VYHYTVAWNYGDFYDGAARVLAPGEPDYALAHEYAAPFLRDEI
jgi:hypothetical protein